MSLAVADASGQAWLQGFNEVGTTIFGKTANELIAIRVSISLLSMMTMVKTDRRKTTAPSTMCCSTKLTAIRTTSPAVPSRIHTTSV